MKKILFVILSAFFAFQSSAQFSLRGEVQEYYYESKPSEKFAIDTGIQNFEDYNFEYNSEWEYFNTSILGTAQQKLSFDWNHRKGFQDGNIFFDNYKYNSTNTKYYDTQKFPYSEISYTIGTRLEQKARLIHAQNIKNRFRFALEAQGLSSSGVYDINQRVRDFGISFYGIYSSKNDRYHLKANVNYSSIKANETGGIVEDVLTANLTNKLFYNTNLDDAVSNQSHLELRINNDFAFGFSRLDSISDSLAIKYFYPVFRLKHSLGTNIVRQSFFDEKTDISYYPTFNYSQDSIKYNLNYHNIPHRIAFEYLGTKNTDLVGYRNIKAEIALQHNNLEIGQNGFEKTYNNLMLELTVQSNEKANSKLTYHFNTSYFLTGYNQRDFSVSAQADYQFLKHGKLGVSFYYDNISPTWIENYYFSPSLSWENEFSKKQNLETNLYYVLKKHKLKINFKANFLSNYIYFNESSTPIQSNARIVYWNASIQKDLHWKIWHWDNFIGYQYTNHQEILPLPSLFLKTSLYAKFRLFKNNILLSAGFDIRFNTAFKTRAWNPIIAQFHVQDQRQIKYTPIADVFISGKVKSLRFYVKLNYANEGLFVANNYKALNYPSNGRSFSVGFNWRFFE